MAIVNRDLDPSQQSSVFTRSITGGVVTGGTYVVANVPYPSQLMAAAMGAYGVSGSPVHSLWIYRFSGGFTSIPVGQSMAVTDYGTSGMQGFSIFAGVSYPLIQGDQLVIYTQGANSGVVNSTVSVVLKALQDIKSSFGAT